MGEGRDFLDIRAQTSDLQDLFNKAYTNKDMQTCFSITSCPTTKNSSIFSFVIPYICTYKKSVLMETWRISVCLESNYLFIEINPEEVVIRFVCCT